MGNYTPQKKHYVITYPRLHLMLVRETPDGNRCAVLPATIDLNLTCRISVPRDTKGSNLDRTRHNLHLDYTVILVSGTNDIQLVTYCGLVMLLHTSVSWVFIGSGNGLSPVRHQVITGKHVDLLSVVPLNTNFSSVIMKIQNFSFRKIWKLTFCSDLKRKY